VQTIKDVLREKVSRKKKQSLVEAYLDRGELPFCFFITVDVIAHFLAFSVGPIKSYVDYFIWLMLPTVFIFGIAIAAVINFERKRRNLGWANAITAALSLVILALPPLAISLSCNYLWRC